MFLSQSHTMVEWPFFSFPSISSQCVSHVCSAYFKSLRKQTHLMSFHRSMRAGPTWCLHPTRTTSPLFLRWLSQCMTLLESMLDRTTIGLRQIMTFYVIMGVTFTYWLFKSSKNRKQWTSLLLCYSILIFNF